MKAWRAVREFRFVAGVTAGTAALLATAGMAALGDGQRVAEWVEALATLAAFIAALIAARYAAKAFRIETQRDEQLAKSRRSEQAAMVAAWFDERSEQTSLGNPNFPVLFHTVEYLVFRNASHVPVTDVSAALWAVALEPMMSGTRDRKCIGVMQMGLLPPAADPVYKVVNGNISDKLAEFSKGARDETPPARVEVLVQLYFTDSSGRRWIRETSGQLDDVSGRRYKDPAVGYR